MIAANLQHFSGKPWAATTQISLPQGDQRILLETRGSRRLSSQSLLDLRVSRRFLFSRMGSVELLVDVLNALNDTAEEDLASDNFTQFRQADRLHGSAARDARRQVQPGALSRAIFRQFDQDDIGFAARPLEHNKLPFRVTSNDDTTPCPPSFVI